MSKSFIATFDDEKSYKKYKADVEANGGTIKHDLESILCVTATIPPTFVQTILSGNLKDNGITTFEPDSTVSIQDDEERAPLVG